MTGLVIVGSMADQGGVNDYAAELLIGSRALELESLTVLNKSATAYYLQLFNLPFAISAARASTTDVASNVNGVILLANHGFADGDYITTTGSMIAQFALNAYVRVLTPDTFQLFNTLANATNRAAVTGRILGAAGGVVTGGIQITTVVDSPLIPEEFPLMGTGSTPNNLVNVLNKRFTRGLYARIVTAVNGSTLGGTDAKFTPRFRYCGGL